MAAENIYESSKQETICVSCECPQDTHLCFWKCPLFENEYICAECCQIDTLQQDIATKVSQKHGSSKTLEEINKACQECGRNYSRQDPSLIPESVNNRNKVDLP